MFVRLVRSDSVGAYKAANLFRSAASWIMIGSLPLSLPTPMPMLLPISSRRRRRRRRRRRLRLSSGCLERPIFNEHAHDELLLAQLAAAHVLAAKSLGAGLCALAPQALPESRLQVRPARHLAGAGATPRGRGRSR